MGNTITEEEIEEGEIYGPPIPDPDEEEENEDDDVREEDAPTK